MWRKRLARSWHSRVAYVISTAGTAALATRTRSASSPAPASRRSRTNCCPPSRLRRKRQTRSRRGRIPRPLPTRDRSDDGLESYLLRGRPKPKRVNPCPSSYERLLELDANPQDSCAPTSQVRPMVHPEHGICSCKAIHDSTANLGGTMRSPSSLTAPARARPTDPVPTPPRNFASSRSATRHQAPSSTTNDAEPMRYEAAQPHTFNQRRRHLAGPFRQTPRANHNLTSALLRRPTASRELSVHVRTAPEKSLLP